MNQLEIKIAQLEKDRAKLLKENRKLNQKRIISIPIIKDTITIRIAYVPDENGNPIYDLEYMRILLERELEKLKQL